MAKGIGGLVGRPIKGGFDFIAQPLVGVLNTPTFIYKKYWSKSEVKMQPNLMHFNIESY